MDTTQQNIDRIHHMVMNDQRLTVNHMANVMSMPRQLVENIIHKELRVPKFRLDGWPGF